MPKNLSLTSKNRIACEYILEGNSVRVAMTKAGYSPLYAEKHCGGFLKNRLVAQYMRKRQEEIAHAHTIDLNYVLRELDKIISKNGVEEKDKVAALKVAKETLSDRKQLELKLKEIENGLKNDTQEKSITIKIEQASREQENKDD